jgi:glycosyltransferase involved in cell wall biosynthesis
MLKRVVHIGGYNPHAMDGVSTALVGQCDALHQLGVPLEIWGFDPGVSEVVEERTSCGIPLIRMPRHRHSLEAVFSFPAVTNRELRTRLPGVACFHLHSVFLPSNNLVADLGVPYVISPHGGWGPRVLKGRNRLAKAAWIFLRERRLWSRARMVQAVSEAEEEELRELGGICEIRYIPNGVKLPSLPDKRGERDLWLFLGRLAIEHKGIDRMLAAYAECKSLKPDLPKLVLAGPDFRGDQAAIRERIRTLGLGDWIELPGPVTGDEKRRLFERASLFLHTSRWEGMPMSILEAMAWEIPCLLTKGTMMVPVVTEAGAGFDAGDSVTEIAAAMARAASAELSAMGRAARDCVATHFSWSTVAAKLAEVYGLHDGTLSKE